MNSPNSPAGDAETSSTLAGPDCDLAGPGRGPGGQELLESIRRQLPDLAPKALEAFFDHYFTRVYGYIRRLVHEEHLAEDLTQDVFLHIQRSLPGYDPARPLSPWVYAIATNKVRDLWRSRRHQEDRHSKSLDSDDGSVLGLAVDGEQPHERLEAREVQDEVRAAVEALPEMLRATFVLRFYEGLSFEDIGRMVDRNEAAVRKRYSRALAELRVALSEFDVSSRES